MPGTWCRCVVEEVDESLTLRYEDGPYPAEARALRREAYLPGAVRFVRVPPDCVRVDYESAYEVVDKNGRRWAHFPFVILLSVLMEFVLYFSFARGPITSYAPVGGPPGWELEAFGAFPKCRARGTHASTGLGMRMPRRAPRKERRDGVSSDS